MDEKNISKYKFVRTLLCSELCLEKSHRTIG